MNPTTEARNLLGPLDPAPLAALPDATSQEADLRRILTSSSAEVSARQLPSLRTRRPLGRVWIAGGVVAASVIAAAALIVGIPSSSTSRAYAATPPALHYQETASAEPAEAQLTAIAARSATTKPVATGKYAHLIVTSWSLTTRIDGRQVTSAVVPTTTESFVAADRSGQLTRRYEAPTFASAADRRRWTKAGAPGGTGDATTSTYSAGQFPQMFAAPAPTDAAAMSSYLEAGHPADNGPAEILIAAADLVKAQVLDPAQRASLLQVLATVPGLASDGAVVDRSGRSGQAYSVTSNFTGLPTRYTVIIDPTSGQLLGLEQTLTTRAGSLNVPISSVVEYETFRVADFRNNL
jgi:hypothetical protein